MTDGSRSPQSRARRALALAAVALIAALIGALGPAREARTTYSWPPDTLSGEAPDAVWYAPLLLVRERPVALVAHVPCSLPPALPGAKAPHTVLATARDATGRGAFEIVRDGSTILVRSGGQELARIPPLARDSGTAECVHTLRLGEGGWSVESPGGVVGEGRLGSMP